MVNFFNFVYFIGKFFINYTDKFTIIVQWTVRQSNNTEHCLFTGSNVWMDKDDKAVNNPLVSNKKIPHKIDKKNLFFSFLFFCFGYSFT